MGRRATPPKGQADAKRPLARKSPKTNLATRLAEALEQLHTRNHELVEAKEQQTATSEILRVISSSPTDVQPVFAAISAAATTLCAAENSGVFLLDGGLIRLAAHHNWTPGDLEAVRRTFPRPPGPGSLTARAILTSDVAHTADLATAPDYEARSLVEAGFRAVLSVPMLRDREPIGAITVTRRVAVPFTATQIALLQTFADQAVIAIENVRLFSELEERNQALTESLEQQTATANILRVISSSPTDARPVFDAIVASAVRLCGGAHGAVLRVEGELIDHVAAFAHDPAVLEEIRSHYPRRLSEAGPGAGFRALREQRIVEVTDTETATDVADFVREAARRMGFRSEVWTPMVRGEATIGAIGVTRREPGGFSTSQIALLRSFTDQAVIAIENVRLFTELQASNRELTTALDTQTATSDILRVISRSQTDVQPVFDAIVHSAVRLLRGYSGGLSRLEGDEISLVALTSTGAEADATLRDAFPAHLQSPNFQALTIRERAPQNLTEIATDPRASEGLRAIALARGYRSVVGVPLLRHGDALGAISVTRREPGGFTDDEIALLQTFADQAVIAIENVRLFNETKEALEQQTATAEILGVISRSPTDVRPVFEVVLTNGVRLCRASFGGVLRFDGELIHLVTSHEWPPEQLEAVHRRFPMPPGDGSLAARAIRDRHVVQTPDYVADSRAGVLPEWVPGGEQRPRSTIAIPMLREGSPVGAIVLARAEPGLFSDKHVTLLQTFADQAVIAIENVRLFNETKEALEQQTATSEILKVISSSRTDVRPVFSAILGNALRLCDGLYGAIFMVRNREIHLEATANINDEAMNVFQAVFPIPVDSEGTVPQVIREGVVVHLPDILHDARAATYARRLAEATGYRCALFIPLIRDDKTIGALALTRAEPRPFSATQIALVRAFADQAVIAVENVRLFTELQGSNRELTTALDTQTATSDILRVISRSQTDVQPVFDAIVHSAVRLLGAYSGALTRVDGDHIVLAALTSSDDDAADAALRAFFPHSVHSGATHAHAIRTRTPFNIADAQADPRVHETVRAYARSLGYYSQIVVPMLRQDEAIGAIAVTRRERGGFTADEIALLQTFADQAVIAIENARLLSELQQRNEALTQAHAQVSEALEQQTATSEVLKVMSRSAFDLQPVLDTLIESAVRLCGADRGFIHRQDGEFYPVAASYGHSPDWIEVVKRNPIRHDRGSATGRAGLERRTIHIHDILAEPEYRWADDHRGQEQMHRTILAVPMLREGVVTGVITIRRTHVQPFTDKQIELVETFADQAIIAIENVRLFTELQASNRELTTALDRQTATSDILRVISQSQTDVQPVFDAIVASAVRLLGAYSGALTRVAGDEIALATFTSIAEASDAAMRAAFPQPLQSAEPHAQVVRERMPLNILDTHTDPRLPEGTRAYTRGRGYRSWVVVPLLRQSEALGAIGVTRREPGGFTDDEIALLQTFADQAVIAIENARLLSELQARTTELTRSVDELTTLGDIGRALSSTLDLETVLQTIVTRANQLTGTAGCTIWEYDEAREEFRLRASHYADEADAAMLQAPGRVTTIPKGQGVTTRVMERRQPIQIHDIAAEGAYESPIRQPLIEAGHRALLGVPLLSEDEVIGVLAVTHKTPGEFEPETVRLLSTFATQSALAIQNARLFLEIEDKSRQLEAASQHKSEFLANMSHELRTPLNAIIGFSEVLADAMFGEVNEKQAEYLGDIQESGRHLLSLINDILDLSKIEAGRMELEPTDFDLPGAIDNALTLVRERAGRRGIALGRAIDERVGTIRGDERKVKQVLLNLLSNALKFTPEGGRIDVRAAVTDGVAEVSVVDTGVGIAPEDQEAVFEEFRQVGTADKKVEGTGLGLALSRKFIELHGGRIWVKSQVGTGSTFTFTLPVRRNDRANPLQ